MEILFGSKSWPSSPSIYAFSAGFENYFFFSIKIHIKYSSTEKTNNKSAVTIIWDYLQQFLWILVVRFFFFSSVL